MIVIKLWSERIAIMARRQIEYLSWSQISKYLRCPYSWYLYYVEKIWPEEKAQPLCFGIAYHAGVETFLHSQIAGDVFPISLYHMQSKFDYEYALGEDKGPDPGKWLPLGDKLLEALANSIIEKGFVPEEVECEASRGGFRGRLDCIGMLEGKRIIVDWKTAGSPFTQKRVDTDGQLTGYSYLRPDCDGVAFVVAVKESQNIYWYPSTRTPGEVVAFKAMVEDVREKMQTSDKFIPTADPSVCKWCDFASTRYCAGSGDF